MSAREFALCQLHKFAHNRIFRDPRRSRRPALKVELPSKRPGILLSHRCDDSTREAGEDWARKCAYIHRRLCRSQRLEGRAAQLPILLTPMAEILYEARPRRISRHSSMELVEGSLPEQQHKLSIGQLKRPAVSVQIN